MRVVSRGYLSLLGSDVQIDPWSISLGDADSQASPVELQDWSYYQPVKVKVSVVAEKSNLLRRLQLGDDAVLAVVVIWTSPGTSLRGASVVVPVGANETPVEFELDGGLLRGDLRLECQIVLKRASDQELSPLAPREPGAVVWSSEHSIRLEGTGSRMPVIAVPFSEHLSDTGHHGLWWLQVTSSDLSSPAESALWMWLNEENVMIQDLLGFPENDGPIVTQHLLKLDFYRQLVEVGLRNEDFSLEEEYPVGSLGAVIADPVSLLGRHLSELRSILSNDPHRLEAEIQSRLGGL